jgi:predicted N-acetyltransferase YhbS
LPLTLIALKSSELLGFVTLVEIPEKAGIEKGVWLITLYVREAHRGVGLGARLAQRCLVEAKRMGYAAIYLWTEFARLTDYYERHGWRLVGRDDVSGDDIMMVELDDVSDSNGARRGGP